MIVTYPPESVRERPRVSLARCVCGVTGWYTLDGVTRCAGCERELRVTWALEAETT